MRGVAWVFSREKGVSEDTESHAWPCTSADDEFDFEKYNWWVADTRYTEDCPEYRKAIEHTILLSHLRSTNDFSDLPT